MDKEVVIKMIMERFNDRVSNNGKKLLNGMEQDLRNAYNEGVLAGRMDFDEQMKKSWQEGFESGKTSLTVQAAIEKLQKDGWLSEHEKHLKDLWFKIGYKKCLAERDRNANLAEDPDCECTECDAFQKGAQFSLNNIHSNIGYQGGLEDLWNALKFINQTETPVLRAIGFGVPIGMIMGYGVNEILRSDITPWDVVEKVKNHKIKEAERIVTNRDKFKEVFGDVDEDSFCANKEWLNETYKGG